MHNHCIHSFRPVRRSLSEILADMARLRQEIAALQQSPKPQATRLEVAK